MDKKYFAKVSSFIKTSIKTIRKSRRNTIVALLVLLLLGFGIFRSFAQSTPAPQYQTAQAENGTLITSVSATGTVSSGSNASITSSATGIISEVYVANGDTVSPGDPIALITLDQSSRQRQTAAWATYLSAQNSVNVAKSKMNTLQATLFEANQEFVTGAGTQNPITDDPTYIIQRANWLQAESDYNNQKGVISQAEAALSSAWLSYQQISSTITAPISGVVSNLSITPGLTIAGNTSNSTTSEGESTNTSSQTLGTITLENGQPQAVVSLSEIDITKVVMGQKVTMTLDAFPQKSFTGRVSGINTNGIVSSGVTNYPVTITFDTAVTNMYPNMAVNATIITDIKSNVLLVPSSAIQTSNGTASVRVRKNGEITSTPVEVGGSNDTQIEIVSGISEGDEVVTGQTGGATRTTGGQQGASPFGGAGFGGRGFGGGGAFRGGGGAGAAH